MVCASLAHLHVLQRMQFEDGDCSCGLLAVSRSSCRGANRSRLRLHCTAQGSGHHRCTGIRAGRFRRPSAAIRSSPAPGCTWRESARRCSVAIWAPTSRRVRSPLPTRTMSNTANPAITLNRLNLVCIGKGYCCCRYTYSKRRELLSAKLGLAVTSAFRTFRPERRQRAG